MKIKTPSTKFGSNLRKIRKSLGLTACELAQRAGITPAAVSQIENGAREPNLTTIVRILSVIPVKFERLIK